MKPISLILSTFFLLFISCNKPEENIQIPEKFELKWEKQLVNSLPLSIIVDSRNNDFLYVASKDKGLLVFKENTNNPTQVANIPISLLGNHHVMNVYQNGNYLYLALGDFFQNGHKSGFAIIDISTPSNPVISDWWEATNAIKGSAIVIVEGNYAFLGAMSDGVYVFDISNKNNISEIEHFTPDRNFPLPNPNSVQEPNARGMAIKNNNLFLCYDAGGIRVLDISDKTNLTEKSRYINSTFNKQKAYNNIYINGNYAYVATDYCGMETLDISNPNQLKLASWCNPWHCESPNNNWLNSQGHTNELSYNPNSKNVYLSSGASQITIIDVSNPNDCKFVTSLGSRNDNLGTWGITFANNKVYTTYITAFIPFTSNWSGLKCFKIN